MPRRKVSKTAMVLKNRALKKELEKLEAENLVLKGNPESSVKLEEPPKESSKKSEPASPANGEIIFWSKAKQTKIANFIPEERALSGALISREGSLAFSAHVLVTSDPKKIAYLKACLSFESGDIRIVDSMDMANQLTMGVDASKTKTEHRSETTATSFHG